MLGDETKRQVYDVYGQQGLEAGLEVVPRSRGADVREQWEQFKKDKVTVCSQPDQGCTVSINGAST